MPATTGSPTPMGAVGPSGRAGAGSASALSEMDSSGLGAALSEVDGSGGGSGSVESPRVVQAAAQYHVWTDSASASSVSDVDDEETSTVNELFRVDRSLYTPGDNTEN